MSGELTAALVFADQLQPGDTIRFTKYIGGAPTPVAGQITQLRRYTTRPLMASALIGGSSEPEPRVVVIVVCDDSSMVDRDFATFHTVEVLDRPGVIEGDDR